MLPAPPVGWGPAAPSISFPDGRSTRWVGPILPGVVGAAQPRYAGRPGVAVTLAGAWVPLAGMVYVPFGARKGGQPREQSSGQTRRTVRPAARAGSAVSEPVPAKDVSVKPGRGTGPGQVEPVRDKLKRLADRGRLHRTPAGRFTTQPPPTA